MVNTSGSEPEELPGLRKAAILMVMIGDEASSTIMRQLDEDEVQEISREIARVGTLTAEEAEGVLEEFYQMAVAHDYVVKGGIDYAQETADQRLRAGDRQENAGPADEDAGQRNPELRRAAKDRSQQLAKFIHSEHPQTIALILSHLNPSQAAGLAVFAARRKCAPMWRCAWPAWIRSRRKSSPKSRP